MAVPVAAVAAGKFAIAHAPKIIYAARELYKHKNEIASAAKQVSHVVENRQKHKTLDKNVEIYKNINHQSNDIKNQANNLARRTEAVLASPGLSDEQKSGFKYIEQMAQDIGKQSTRLKETSQELANPDISEDRRKFLTVGIQEDLSSLSSNLNDLGDLDKSLRKDLDKEGPDQDKTTPALDDSKATQDRDVPPGR